MPTFGSLFAGIGGIDLGLERAGWTGRWQVEWDEYCQHVLAHHWPDIPRYGDITTVDWSGVEPVDLIAGGFPCQPFSLAGRRRGKSDDRWLWPAFAAAIRALRPRYVLVENVPGLLAGHGGMGSVLGDLADLGYDAEWDSIPAAAVGAPHLRYRVWIVAYSRGDEHQGGASSVRGASGAQLPPDSHGDPVRVEPLGLERRRNPSVLGLDGAFGSLADSTSDGWESWRQGDSAQGAERREPDRSSVDAPVAHANGSGPQGRPIHPERADQRTTGAGSLAHAASVGGGALGTDGSGSRWADGPSRSGRYWESEPDVGRVAHGVPARVDRLRALGNAVVPQVVEVIGRRLLAVLEAEKVA